MINVTFAEAIASLATTIATYSEFNVKCMASSLLLSAKEKKGEEKISRKR